MGTEWGEIPDQSSARSNMEKEIISKALLISNAISRRKPFLAYVSFNERIVEKRKDSM